jgi:hypothetical protein
VQRCTAPTCPVYQYSYTAGPIHTPICRSRGCLLQPLWTDRTGRASPLLVVIVVAVVVAAVVVVVAAL